MWNHPCLHSETTIYGDTGLSAWLFQNHTRTRLAIGFVVSVLSWRCYFLVTGLAITFSRNLSASEHIGNILKSCSQSLYAPRLLRAHEMCDTEIQAILGQSSLLNSPMQLPASAWRGFTKVSERQRIDHAFLRRSKHCGYYTLHIYRCLINFAIQLMNNYLIIYGWTLLAYPAYSLLPPESQRRRTTVSVLVCTI